MPIHKEKQLPLNAGPYRRLTPAVAAGLGVTATLALFFLVQGWETNRLRTSFERAAAGQVAAISRGVEHGLEKVVALGGLFASSHEVERREFHAFVTQIHAHPGSGHDYLQALEWIPRVGDGEREAYEAAARREGLAGFRITERQTQGVMVPAARRKEYFPVYLVEPLAKNEAAVGFDLASNPVRLNALNHSRDSGKMVVTARITLVQEAGRQYGFLAFRPVYHEGAPQETVEDRRAHLLGFALGVFRVGDLVEKSISSLEPQGIGTYLFDDSASAGERQLYPSPSRGRSMSLPPATESNLTRGLNVSHTLRVADRNWRILCVPTPAFFAAAPTGEKWWVLVIGLLGTGLLTVYLRLVLTRSEEVRWQARELAIAKDSLELEIAERRQVEAKLRLAGQVFKHSSEMIVVTDLKLRVVEVNSAFSQITGFSGEEAAEREILFLKPEPNTPVFFQKLAETLFAGGYWQGEMTIVLKDGSTLPLLATINAIWNEKGELTHYIGMATDISRLKGAEERLLHMAYFDPLTDLPNRALLQDRLRQALHDAERRRSQLALLFLDLDNFKDINDSFGHPVGDQVLMEMARRLAELVRRSDTVARMGGDEFVIVMRGLSQPEHSMKLARRIHAAFSSPFCLESCEIYVTLSIGIALYPHDGQDADELIKKADTALAHAKNRGRDGHQYFSEEMDRSVKERLLLQTQLRRAVERDEFVPYFQPKVDLCSGEIDGVEVVVRWQHSEKGLVLPGAFIPLAEETGLIVPIGERILEMACRQARHWLREGLPPLHLAVNLSAVQLRREGLTEKLGQILEETGLDPHWLELEITESAVMENPEKAAEILRTLKAAGIPHISMDDFGTGYSSLNYLRRFPLDTLKIDYSFIKDIPENPEVAVLVKTIIIMAKNLNLKVIAEGVEREEQMTFLRENGCNSVQGFYLFRPMPGEELMRVLKDQAVKPAPPVLAQAKA